MKEIWKDIPGFEGVYQASTLGNIKSLDRKIKKWNGFRKVKGQILKQQNNPNGYLCVSLSSTGRSKTFKVHQLIAVTFLNHKPNGFKMVVDHINNVKTDNHLVNLQILSSRRNSIKERGFGVSKYLGVCKSNVKSKPWRATIYLNGKNNWIGDFETEILAHKAYQKRLKFIENGK